MSTQESAIERQVARGLIGVGAATVFVGFLESRSSLFEFLIPDYQWTTIVVGVLALLFFAGLAGAMMNQAQESWKSDDGWSPKTVVDFTSGTALAAVSLTAALDVGGFIDLL